MASTSRSSSSRRLTMVSLGARLYLLSLLSLLLFGSIIITPAVSSPTAVPPADHESILHALRFQGMTATADALDNVIWNRAFLVPANATLFIPLNDAMAPVAASLNVTELIDLLSYHIVTESLPVGRFTKLPVGTKLKTMATNSYLVVTENSKRVTTINHREVMPKDLCTISTVACYAVTEVLLLGEKKKKSFGALVAAPAEALVLPPSGGLPPVEAPIIRPAAGLPLPPLGAPVAPPVVPPVGSPVGTPVPAGPPTAFPPLGSPQAIPVPTGAPPVIISPPPGSPGGAPLSPGEAPGGASSAAMATTASIATLVAAVMLTILVL